MKANNISIEQATALHSTQQQELAPLSQGKVLPQAIELKQATTLHSTRQQELAPLPLGKVLPKAIEIEQSILAALLLEKYALTEVIDILRPDSFYEIAHQEIYTAILQLFNDAAPVDLRTVVNQLRKNNKLESVGGAYYITTITYRASSAANIVYHVRILTEYAIKRQLIQFHSSGYRQAYDDTTDVFALLDYAEQKLFEITDINIRKNYVSVPNLLGEAFKDLEARSHQNSGLSGIASGFALLDNITSGWQKSDLVIIAARPGMGKTSFMLSVLRNAAIDYGHPVAIFSLEMSSLQLTNRLMATEAEVESEKIKKAKLSEYEWYQLTTKTMPLSQAPIYIDDTPALTIFELRTKARRLKAKHDVRLIIVDYLQMMSAQTPKGGNREQEIATISRALKNLAKELDIPVIAASQLSRSVETRGGNKRPILSDLRESGSIEQDADLVLFLYRPEYYGITEDGLGSSTQGFTELIIAKHRNGSLDTIPLKFVGKYTKFIPSEEEE
jgi:replicative DNA helicase